MLKKELKTIWSSLGRVFSMLSQRVEQAQLRSLGRAVLYPCVLRVRCLGLVTHHTTDFPRVELLQPNKPGGHASTLRTLRAKQGARGCNQGFPHGAPHWVRLRHGGLCTGKKYHRQGGMRAWSNLSVSAGMRHKTYKIGGGRLLIPGSLGPPTLRA